MTVNNRTIIFLETVFSRVCHPGPIARSFSTNSRSSLSDTGCLRFLGGSPRRTSVAPSLTSAPANHSTVSNGAWSQAVQGSGEVASFVAGE